MITSVKIEKSRVDRAYSVSDVTLTVNGTQLKLWLPRRACLRRRWEAILRNDIFRDQETCWRPKRGVAAAAGPSRRAGRRRPHAPPRRRDRPRLRRR